MTPPVYLSIAGSDCSAGAGLQADLKTGFALGCYPLTAVTCVVSEVPGKVESLTAIAPELAASQVRLCLGHFPVAAIKTGMLYSPEIVQAVAATLREFPSCPLVIDPVMIATAGEPLMLKAALAAYEECLFPLATVLTPNLDELARLLRRPVPPRTAAELGDAATELAARYRCAILAKGGHLGHDMCTDVLAMPDGSSTIWEHPRAKGLPTHGTGCTLSSAITAYLAHGHSLQQAVELAVHYTARSIASSHHLGSMWVLNHGK